MCLASENKNMITTPTVFVLGAGASQPYGFPIGSKLNELLLSGYEKADQFAFGDCSMPKFFADEFRKSFREARATSIDTFLQQCDERTRTLGKRLVAATIALHENINALFPKSGDWLQILFNVMGREATANSFTKNRVSFITFNYDRSLEMALQLHLYRQYRMPERHAFEVVNQLPIFHVHGSLGPLGDDVSSPGRPYTPDIRWLDPLMKNCHLIHEDQPGNGAWASAIEMMAQAKRVVFLGFAFHELNCQRLFCGIRDKGSQWRASAFGMTAAECNVARKLAEGAVLRGQDSRATTENGLHVIDFGASDWDARHFMRENIDWLYD